MRDQIDLEQSAQAARQERRKIRQSCLSVLAMAGLAVLLIYGFMTVFPSMLFDSGDLFYLDAGRWQEIKDLPGSPQDVQISPGGAVWVQTSSKSGLARLDGDRWQHYRGKDYGAKTNSLRGGFTLVGEQVWGVSEEAVIHFDGQAWTAYPEALSSDSAEDIAAGESEAWVIDEKGNLSHFDGEAWTIAHLRDAIPDVRWGGIIPSPSPDLAWTPDGTLWLIESGLWRFDGAAWQGVHYGENPLKDARLAGVTNQRLWLWSDHSLLWTNGQDWGRYTLDDLGLAADARVYQVAAQGERLWVATSAGALTFDGTTWELLPLPAGQDYVSRVALAPDGTLWAIGQENKSLIQAIFPLILLLAAGIGVVALIFVLMHRNLKDTVHKQTQRRETLRQAVPGLPEVKVKQPQPLSKPSLKQVALWPVKLVVRFAILAGLLFITDRLIVRYWPDAPRWLVIVIPFAVWFIISESKRLVAAWRAARDGGSPLGQKIWQGAKKVFWPILIFILIAFFPTNLARWLPPMGTSSIIAVFLLLPLALIMLVPLVVFLLPFFWALAPVRRANYAGALRRVLFLRRLRSHSATFLYLHGTVHLFAGEYQEAEARLRESLEQEQKGATPTMGSTLENLGCALRGQGRYEEAVKAIESAIEISPDAAGCYISLADVYLRQGVQPERVLELLAQAQENKSSSILRSRADRHRWAEIWASRAWALTLQGRHAEAAEALEQALAKRDRKFKPGLADLHCRAGQVMRLRGDKAAAIEHWRQAQQIDPRGEAGQWAGRLLQELT